MKTNRKQRKARPKPKGRSNASQRPTLVLDVHAQISQSISGVNIKQINIMPTASVFDQFNNNVARFQQYRVTRIWYDFYAVQNVNVVNAGRNDALALTYTVPLESNQIPTPSVSSYLAFKNVKVREFDRKISGSFVPYCYTDLAETGLALRSPLISTKQPNQICYGHSMLFYKPSPTASDYIVQGVLSARI